MKTRLFLALSALGFCTGAVADAGKPWEVATELGVIATTGNTETTSIQAKLDAKHNLRRWHNNYILTALYKEDQITLEDDTEITEQTAEKYFGSVKSAYQLERENTNFFMFASHADDKFGSYRKYTTLAIGYGTRLYQSDTMVLDTEIGPGYYRAEQVLAEDVTQRESGMLVRGAASFKWQISETAEFVQTLSVDSAEDNTRTVAESSVTTRIIGALQLKVGINIANDSSVAPDKEKTDTTSYVNVVYNF